MRSLAVLLSFVILSACGSAVSGIPNQTGVQTPGANPDPDSSAQTYSSSCDSNDPEFQCLGLKIVSFENENGSAVLKESESLKLVAEMNQVWKTCKIGFQLEKYESLQPQSQGLPYSPDWKRDSDTIRARFDEESRFLVVAVGPWTNATIAVAQMPGKGPFGVLVSEKYSKNALTVGHELGHYQGLYHLRNKKNLMNSFIGPFTSGLGSAQCSIARRTNVRYWQKMLRGRSAALLRIAAQEQ
ncbi:MAG: hypothetical protein KGP28_04145 [Bdellovibrionales bacterium]|nr:hypothetical protein [Bdellovibrionales bacterium]